MLESSCTIIDQTRIPSLTLAETTPCVLVSASLYAEYSPLAPTSLKSQKLTYQINKSLIDGH